MTSSSPLPEIGRSTLAAAREASFWRELNPGFSITETPFDEAVAAYEVEPTVARGAAEQIARQGFFQVPPIIPGAETERLAHGVLRVVDSGFPPPFALIYDEYWRVLGRLTNLLTPVLGEDHRILPDFWVWCVDGSAGRTGWPAHRDREFDVQTLRPDGRPTVVTVWIPFTDATPRNSCIYVLPTDLDPCYPDRLDEASLPLSALGGVRALPAAAGSVLCWNQYLLHWGSQGDDCAGAPRISMGVYFQSGDAPPSDLGSLLPPARVPFDYRLGAISRMVEKYRRFGVPDDLLEFCRNHAKLFKMAELLRMERASRDREAGRR